MFTLRNCEHRDDLDLIVGIEHPARSRCVTFTKGMIPYVGRPLAPRFVLLLDSGIEPQSFLCLVACAVYVFNVGVSHSSHLSGRTALCCIIVIATTVAFVLRLQYPTDWTRFRFGASSMISRSIIMTNPSSSAHQRNRFDGRENDAAASDLCLRPSIIRGCVI